MTIDEITQLKEALGPATVLIETHISWVLLDAAFAYKIKKPLQFSFLDFSSAALRAHYCERELALNRRLAAEIYLEVIPIYATNGKIQLANADDAVCIDHALKMKRLDAAMEMDRMLAADKIPLSYMRILADKMARFHKQAAVIKAVAQSSAESYRSDFNDILQQLPFFTAKLGKAAGVRLEAIVKTSDAFLLKHAKLIAQRREAGWVRDVHGDLHARNVFAYPDPIVFDCIEFNDHFRQIDVLNEIAFFCMDLEATDFPEHADDFLEAYLDASPAMPGPKDALLFNWFKCYRANVRCKVAALQAQQNPHPALINEIRCYLDLMSMYALELV